eukprot:scaffold62428_cov58-Attheya_sp.AAC.2
MTIHKPLFNEVEDSSMEYIEYYLNEIAADNLANWSIWVSGLGDANCDNFSMPLPPKDIVEKMMYTVCAEGCHDYVLGITNTSPMANLDDDQFDVYVTFYVWVKCSWRALVASYSFGYISSKMLAGQMKVKSAGSLPSMLSHFWQPCQFS